MTVVIAVHIVLRRVWLHKFKLLLLVYLFIVWFYYLFFKNSPLWLDTIRTTCSLEDDISFLADLCHNHTYGHVSGTFCSSICEKKDLEYLECMSHKSTSRIVLAKWKAGPKLVLKTDIISPRTRAESAESNVTFWTELMKFFISNNFSLPVIRRILSECDKGSDGVFSPEEVMYCRHLAERSEILIMMALAGNSGIPHLYGTCGNLVAVEYVSSLPLETIPKFKEFRSWKLRSKIAIALIEMVEALEDTKYGTLLLCDFQRSNFGIVEVNNTFVAKSIDNDISFFRNELLNSIKSETTMNCTSNDDCNFLECEVACQNGKCSGKLLSNNLENLCRRILSRARFGISVTGLLDEPPDKVLKELTALLHRCAYPLTRSTKISSQLTTQLKKVLMSSIRYDSK